MSTLDAARKTPKQSRESLAERAYRELKRRILDGLIPVGQQFMEQEVAELLDMSRTPTREALLRLANEGLIEIRPRHGMRIKPISIDDMLEIYDVLTALESTAAGLAATRGLSKGDIADLQKAVADMDAALADDDLDAWAEADERFHRLLVELSGNERIQGLVKTFIDQAHRVRMVTLRLRPKPTASNKDHRAVVRAIVKGDAGKARQIHFQHRERSGKLLASLLLEHGLNQF